MVQSINSYCKNHVHQESHSRLFKKFNDFTPLMRVNVKKTESQTRAIPPIEICEYCNQAIARRMRKIVIGTKVKYVCFKC